MHVLGAQILYEFTLHIVTEKLEMHTEMISYALITITWEADRENRQINEWIFPHTPHIHSRAMLTDIQQFNLMKNFLTIFFSKSNNNNRDDDE